MKRNEPAGTVELSKDTESVPGTERNNNSMTTLIRIIMITIAITIINVMMNDAVITITRNSHSITIEMTPKVGWT